MSTRSLSPWGVSCWRCWSPAGALRGRPRPPQQPQWRGKKKLATPSASTVNVRLLQDVVKYGRQGAIVPVAAGRMRNDWFPRRVAEYVTQLQLRAWNMKDASFDRDVNFGIVHEKPEAEPEPEPAMERPEVAVELLSPDRAMELLSERLPPSIDFYRTPILQAQLALPSLSAASSADQMTDDALETVAIYGSVSTTDIVNSIKALLADDEEGSRVVLTSDDVRFVNVEGSANEGATDEGVVETDRVKRLGTFHIRIQVKDDSSIQRVIRVRPQASDPALVQGSTAT